MSNGIDDELNRSILAVAEDRLSGFYERPFGAIAEACGAHEQTVMQRLRDMLQSGVVRCLRQTLPSTALTRGCLVAWKLPEHKLQAAYDWLRQSDPFTGHVVIRRADDATAPGADYRLWTTLKVPASNGDLERHCRAVAAHTGAQEWACMPVVGMFSLSVGHVRRAALEPGALQAQEPTMQKPPHPVLSPQEHAVLLSFRKPLSAEEIAPCPWEARARAMGLEPEEYYRTAHSLVQQGALGRFAAVLNHTVRHPGLAIGAGALLMWAVEPGMEEAAGAACGRHVCMTHCYWRSGAERFGGVQIMGVVHAKEREGVLSRKAAIDSYLQQRGIRVRHSALFFTEQAHIRPSEIDPQAWQEWISRHER